MKKRNVAVFAVLFLVTASFGQGSLTPPGAPAPTMKTLNELDTAIAGVSNAVSEIQDEARTPISTANYYISSPGSYYLITDLVLSGMDWGISIGADNVTVDLNGFSIRGAGVHSSGITLSDRNDVVIKNGTIRDCYYYGIAALRSARCRFENLRIINNGRSASSYDGIHAGPNTTIKGCLVMENGSGIEVDGESTITGNQIVGNRNDGLLLTGSGSYVAENIVKGNGDNYDLSSGNQLNILLSEIPESLDWPCSVKLAGTLTCTNTGVNGITVNADDVSIDLDGHTLIGPGASSGCGIYQVDTFRNLSVENGKVVGWRGVDKGGIYVQGTSSYLHTIQVSANYYGIHTATNSTISDCTAYDNAFTGIYVDSFGRISDCLVSKNGGSGIHASDGITISGCMAQNNGNEGIYVNSGCTISGCVAKNNTHNGITISSDCRVVGNTCYNNKNSNGNGTGIRVWSSDNRIEGNNVTDNDRGIDVNIAGNFITRNTASGNTVNWDVGAGNACLVVYRTGCSAISGDSGGTAPGSTDPNANFTY